jgi:hypothetical protein
LAERANVGAERASESSVLTIAGASSRFVGKTIARRRRGSMKACRSATGARQESALRSAAAWRPRPLFAQIGAGLPALESVVLDAPHLVLQARPVEGVREITRFAARL